MEHSICTRRAVAASRAEPSRDERLVYSFHRSLFLSLCSQLALPLPLARPSLLPSGSRPTRLIALDSPFLAPFGSSVSLFIYVTEKARFTHAFNKTLFARRLLLSVVYTRGAFSPETHVSFLLRNSDKQNPSHCQSSSLYINNC